MGFFILQWSCYQWGKFCSIVPSSRCIERKTTEALFRSWSDCSRSCGGGIRRSERVCDRPAPKNGGLHCVGDRKRYESCETFDCEIGANDYRLEQCQKVSRAHLAAFITPVLDFCNFLVQKLCLLSLLHPKLHSRALIFFVVMHHLLKGPV